MSAPKRELSPLRTIVAIEPNALHPMVLMDRLECGHVYTHDGEADRQTRRRCPGCRLGHPPAPALGDDHHKDPSS